MHYLYTPYLYIYMYREREREREMLGIQRWTKLHKYLSSRSLHSSGREEDKWATCICTMYLITVDDKYYWKDEKMWMVYGSRVVNRLAMVGLLKMLDDQTWKRGGINPEHSWRKTPQRGNMEMENTWGELMPGLLKEQEDKGTERRMVNNRNIVKTIDGFIETIDRFNYICIYNFWTL